MKAVIMAGGEGTRLRPVSSNRPKPMVRLFDKPVLGHIINLLKKNGISEACLTLRYLPKVVTDYVGGGSVSASASSSASASASAFGVSIESRIETEPLGTAGGVKACSDFLGNEDFLIISGDCVCDFDLEKVMDFHRQKGADATIVLYAHPNPVEYGIVVTGPEGRVERFMEKPAGNKVFTDLINTGIYVLSPAVLSLVPEGESYDFGKDLFPKLLSLGKKVYGVRAEGYWCDIGSCEAYLQCAMDMLDKKYSLDMDIPKSGGGGDGVWSSATLSPDVNITPPCYIGKNTVLEPGCSIGPYAVLGEGSHISRGAVIERSVVDGAHIGPNVDAKNSVILRGASVREGALLSEGSVIGEDTIIGEGTVVHEKVRIWPGKEIPAGSSVRENLVSGMLRSGLRFSGGSVISGEFSIDVTPEACIAIGTATASAFREEPVRVGVGFAGGGAARIAAKAIECGVCSAGGEVVELDGGFGSVFSYAVDLYGLSGGIFVSWQDDRLTLWFFDKNGLRISREKERKIEAALAGGDFHRASGQKIGNLSYTAGNAESYIASAVRWGNLGGRGKLKVSVPGTGGPVRAAREALKRLGVQVTNGALELPVFYITGSGFLFRAKDERGREIDSGRLLCLLALIEFENGAGEVAVPYTAPASLDILARNYGTKVLRLDRDKGAEELYYRQPFLRDGIFAAARLAGAMSLHGESLGALNDRAPVFVTARYEIPVLHSKAAVMRELQNNMSEFATELFSGLRANTGKGWVHIAPSVSRQILKITGEGADMEAAEEICGQFKKRAEEIDKGL